MSGKMTILGLLKINLFWNKGYDVIVFVYGITNNILLRDTSYIVDVIVWPKLGNFSISKRKVIITSILWGFDQKNFFERWFCFKFNNLGIAQGMALKFYTSMSKGFELQVKTLWGLILTFVEVIIEKLIGGFFAPFHTEYG